MADRTKAIVGDALDVAPASGALLFDPKIDQRDVASLWVTTALDTHILQKLTTPAHRAQFVFGGFVLSFQPNALAPHVLGDGFGFDAAFWLK